MLLSSRPFQCFPCLPWKALERPTGQQILSETYSIDENNTDKIIKYRCEYCDYRASLKSQLTRHVQFIHDGVKYSCEFFYYKATTKSSLK